MIRSFLFSMATAALAMSAPLLTMSSVPSAVLAQTLVPSLPPGEPANECFAVYPFGQVSLEASSPAAGASFAPGDVVGIAGRINNPSHAVLPDGKVFVRVLREDDGVAAEHWHPIVAELMLADVDVPATTGATPGEQLFSSEWQIPAFAPPGAYRVEFSFLAGDGSPIVGVPYVANVFGASASFSVQDGGRAAAVAFERNKVLFNGSPFAFRAVPPRPEPGPLTIVAPLQAVGNASLSVTVEKSLYSWTDMEGDTLISSTIDELVVAPGESVPVSFTWEAPLPGVYELVLKAMPLDTHVVPSLLRVRFYYEGTVPRILHAGMREEEDGSTTVAACFFNSTFGPEGGSGTFRIESENTIVEEISLDDVAAERIARARLSASVVKAGFILIAEARDSAGVVTDTERIIFPGTTSPSSSPNLLPASAKTWSLWGVGVIVILLLTFFMFRERRQRHIRRSYVTGILVLVFVGLGSLVGVHQTQAYHEPDESLYVVQRCTGSHCTIVDIWSWFFNQNNQLLSSGFAISLHATMSVDTVLQAPANGFAPQCDAGQAITIPISSSGEIIGAGWSFYDSPPIQFLPNGLVRATTAGLALPCRSFDPSLCQGIGDLNVPIEGTWTDTWTVTGVTAGSVQCSTSAEGTTGTCVVAPGTKGDIAVQLKRSFDKPRWTFSPPRANANSTKSPVVSKGSVYYPADMITSTKITCPAVSTVPNLGIQTASLLPTAPVHNDGISVKASIENKGTGNAAATVTRLRFDENADGTWDVGPFTTDTAALNINGTASAAWTSAWTAPGGTHRLEVCADTHNTVAESDETDNCKVVIFTVKNPALTCTPATQAVALKGKALFTASGGGSRTPFYRWLAPSGSPVRGEGGSFSTLYETSGTKTASLIEHYVDVNGDGYATAFDAQAIMNALRASNQPTATGTGARWQNQANKYDVNGDGTATRLDAQIANDYASAHGTGPLPTVDCAVTVKTTEGGTPTYETPPTVLCTPATQSVAVNEPATLRSTLGSKTRWEAPGGSPALSGGSQEFTTTYAVPGTYTVTVPPPFFYDVNGDGYVTSFDPQIVAAKLDGRSTTPPTLTGGAWQNPKNPYDVNNDGHVVPIDALVVINYLNRFGVSLLPLTTCTVNVTKVDVGPTASFDVPPTVNLNETITAVSTSKVGTCSTGSCSTLTNTWQVTRLVDSTNVTPSINTTPTISIVGDKVGDYRFTLTVTDGLNRQSTATKIVRVVSPPSEPPGGPQALCTPLIQMVAVGSLANFASAIGDTAARWSAPEGTPSSGSGGNFSASFATVGMKKVAVSAPVPPHLDVNGDGSVTNEDALEVLNNIGSTTGPGNGSPWQNQANRFDVNGGGVTPQDMLVVINYLNAHGAGKLPSLECQVEVQAGSTIPPPSVSTPGPFNPGPTRETE